MSMLILSTPCRSGFLQGSFFFLYMLMVSYSWFLLLGTVGWRASLLFVRHIYRCASNIVGIDNKFHIVCRLLYFDCVSAVQS